MGVIMKKKAEVGFASLIILTAIIIVAAVVFVAVWNLAPITIQEAREVAKETSKNVGTASAIHKIFAEDGTTSHSVDYFYAEIKPPYGSEEYKFSESLLVFALQNISNEYLYDYTINCSSKDAADANSIYNDSNADSFGVQYVAGTYTYNDTIIGGELVRLCWKSPESVVESQFVDVRFYNKNALSARLKVAYKGLISFDKTIYYFP